MRLLNFTFKNEAVWMVVFSVAPVVLGFLILLITIFVLSL